MVVLSRVMLLAVVAATTLPIESPVVRFQSSVSILGVQAFRAASTGRYRHQRHRLRHAATSTFKARSVVVTGGGGGEKEQEQEKGYPPNTADLKSMRTMISSSKSSKHRIRGESMSSNDVVDRRSFWSRSCTVIAAISFCPTSPKLSWAETLESEHPNQSPSTPSTPSSSLTLGLVEEGPERIKLKRKPSAPIGALIPSIQQRLLLEVCIDAAKSKDLQKLKSIIPPLSLGSEEDSQKGVVGFKFGNFLSSGNDGGMISSSSNQLRILKQNDPSRVLRGDVTRVAMDLYQVNLNYNTIFNEAAGATSAGSSTDGSNDIVKDVVDITDPVWKKSYIRSNDGLNSDFISKVIGADIDLRQLLRNQVQTNLDDAAAELYYVSGNDAGNNDDDSSGSSCDCDELVNLLQSAAKNFDLWLDRVRYGDVRDAIQMVLSESGKATSSTNIRIYESFQAGFIPPSTSHKASQ